MFDFTEINKFRDSINNALEYFQKFSFLPKTPPNQFNEKDFIISDEDFEKIRSKVVKLIEEISTSESLVIKEIKFNIVSIEGESKGYLYAQELHDTLKQLPTVVVDSMDFYTKYQNQSSLIRLYVDEWCIENNVRSLKSLPNDAYLLKCARAINGITKSLNSAYNATVRIEEYFKTTYWYVRYPEKFGGIQDPIGYTPILYESNNIEGLKLQWNCKPAVAGYIISELIRAGYLEPPTTNGELSYAKLAGICNHIFDIRSDGKSTTLDYLKKVVNPESNPLPDHKRAKLNLPDLDQLI